MKYIIGAALFAVSISSGVFSAILSFTGLGAAFPGIPFVGGIGAVIALTTVAVSAATSQARKHEQFGLFRVCAVLMAFAMLLDFGANITATTGEVDTRSVEFQQAESAYNTAQSTLTETRRRIGDAEKDLEKVLGDNVEAAQLVLVSYGHDIQVDGNRGPQTRSALADVGRTLRNELTGLKETEKQAADTVSQGLPENSSSGDLAFAVLLAAMLTILSASMSYIAGALIGGEEVDLDELENAIDKGFQDVTRLEEWLDRKSA